MESSCSFPETADIETSSDDYARRFSGRVGNWFLKVQEEATLRMLAAHPAASILDVGGGHGQLVEALVRNGYRVTVFGSSDVCKMRIQKFIDGNRCSFEVGNILQLPYPPASFDVILSYRLLSHVTRWPEFLSGLARVAKTGVMIDYPAVQSINFIAPQLCQSDGSSVSKRSLVSGCHDQRRLRTSCDSGASGSGRAARTVKRRRARTGRD